MKSRICIVASNFYPEITKNLIEGALKKLKKSNFFNVKLITVPGTFEIPVVVSNLVNKYDAFIVLGCVIKGETPHFDYLCSSVFKSLSALSVRTKVPISNGILTCNNKKQAKKRADLKKIDKGGKAALASIAVLKLVK